MTWADATSATTPSFGAVSSSEVLIDSQTSALNKASLSGAYGYSQSFKGTNASIRGGALWLNGTTAALASANGITASIYAHSGTYGTSSVPTGSALASVVIPPEQAAAKVPFLFTPPLSVTSGTAYELAVEITTFADITIDYYIDDGSIHAGNMARKDLNKWTVLPLSDLRFELYTTRWSTPSTSYASGNFSLFVDADPIADGSGGIDFSNTFSSENPFVFTSYGPIAFVTSTRENP